MLGLPQSTEFNKRIPKQKFYEHITVSPALKKSFVDQIRMIYWRNKVAATTVNLAPGTIVDEVEESCRRGPPTRRKRLRRTLFSRLESIIIRNG